MIWVRMVRVIVGVLVLCANNGAGYCWCVGVMC